MYQSSRFLEIPHAASEISCQQTLWAAHTDSQPGNIMPSAATAGRDIIKKLSRVVGFCTYTYIAVGVLLSSMSALLVRGGLCEPDCRAGMSSSPSRFTSIACNVDRFGPMINTCTAPQGSQYYNLLRHSSQNYSQKTSINSANLHSIHGLLLFLQLINCQNLQSKLDSIYYNTACFNYSEQMRMDCNHTKYLPQSNKLHK